MKRIKLLIAAIAVSVFGINASAQYWGESEVTNYVYAGFTSLKVGETLPGFHIGLGDLNSYRVSKIVSVMIPASDETEVLFIKLVIIIF